MKKRLSYGTVLVDHDTRKIIEIIPSRDVSLVSEALQKYPNIKKVTRDGSVTYANAITKGVGEVEQISDRFHLFKGLTETLELDLKKLVPSVIIYEKAKIVKKETNKNIKKVDKPSKYEEKMELIKKIKKRYQECPNYSRIAEEFHLDRHSIKKYITSGITKNSHSSRRNAFECYREDIINGVENNVPFTIIYEKIQKQGCQRTYNALKSFISNLKVKLIKGRYFTRTNLFKLLYDKSINDLKLSDAEHQGMLNYLKENHKILHILTLYTKFRILMYSHNPNSIDSWMEEIDAIPELVETHGFVNGLRRDISAVKNAIENTITNGIVEGSVNKIKLIKRTMFNRCSFELLRNKIFLRQND